MTDDPIDPKLVRRQTGKQPAYRQAAQRVGLALWQRDGMPERHAGDPTSAYRGLYLHWAEEVLRQAVKMGFRIKPPGRPRNKTRAAP